MPLRAYIEDKEIVSIDLNDEEWSALKARLKAKEIVLTLPCCGQEGFLRTSSRGLKHFVHSKSANPCDWKPESAEHLKAKVAIMEACRKQGWNAIPEFSEADWRADVLAVQGGKRIAFEVQWSRQTYEETRLRQERYKASNVRGCWFFRIVPKEMSDYDKTLVADKETPAFKIFSRKRCNWTPRGRMYCARRPLACYVHDTRFAWAVRVAYFCCGQRRPECGISQCGNPRFLWPSITITLEIPPCSTVGRSPSSPRASSHRPSRNRLSAGPMRVAQPTAS